VFKILILEDSPQLIDRIAFLLESVSGVSLEKASTREEAQAIVEAYAGPVDLLILDYHKSALPALQELSKLTSHVDCIVCVQDRRTLPTNPGFKILSYIERKSMANLLLLTVENWRNERLEKDAVLEHAKYCRIKTNLLIDVSPLNSDIYVKLSDTKYLKLFSEGDVFTSEDLSRYAQQKKIEYMYLLKETCHEFIEKYVTYLDQLINSSKIIPVETIAKMHTSVTESVYELTAKLGFTKEVQSMARAQVALTVKSMGKKPALKDVLQRLEAQTGSYVSDHSFLTGYIACGIASNLEWSSEATYHKLMLAAFMHDIVLNDQLAACESEDDAINLGITEAELNAFKKHPIKVSDMIRLMTDVPPDVDAIVQQHHELPNGQGFPRKISATHISPLSAIFILAHDMAKVAYHQKDHFDLNVFLKDIPERYPQNLFKKLIVSAQQLKF
jgi:response regulator RpfG family c-di-GMP phosphodiesterase